MSLVGDILYRWKGNTEDLEKAQKRAGKILSDSEKQATNFSKTLKTVGVIAGGVAVAGLMEYYGVLGKVGKAVGSTTGLIAKLGTGLGIVAGLALKAFSPISTLLKTIAGFAIGGIVAGLSKLGAILGVQYTAAKNLILPFTSLVSLLEKLGIVSLKAGRSLSFLGGAFRITDTKKIIVSFSIIFDFIKKGVSNTVGFLASLPAKIGAGLASLGQRLHPIIGDLSKRSITIAHILQIIHEGFGALGGPLGRATAGFAALGVSLEAVQAILTKLGLAPTIDMLNKIAASIFGVITVLGLLVRQVAVFTENVGNKILTQFEEWVISAGEMQRSIWGLGVALEGYKKRVGETTLSLEDFTDKTRQLSVETGMSMDVMHQGVLQMMDLARVTGLSAEQIYVLLGRLADFSTVTHTDFMSVVYAVDQAFRGYWRSLSSLGLQMDETALANSAFGKGIDQTKQGVANATVSTAKFNFLMHEMDFVAGKAADSVGKTLPDAMRYNEAATKNLHNIMASGQLNIWTPYYHTLGKVKMAISKMPDELLKLGGALYGLTGAFMKVVSWTVKWGASIIALMGIYKVAQILFTKGLPFGPTWLQDKPIKNMIAGLFGLKNAGGGVKAIFTSIAGIIGKTLLESWKAFMDLMKVGLSQIGNLIWGFKGWILVISGVAAVLAAAGYALYTWINANKLAIEKHTQLIAEYEQEISKLNELDKVLKDSSKSYEDKQNAIASVAVSHRELSKTLKEENGNTSALIPTIKALTDRYKELSKVEKERAIGAYKRELQSTEKKFDVNEVYRQTLLKLIDTTGEAKDKTEKYKAVLGPLNAAHFVLSTGLSTMLWNFKNVNKEQEGFAGNIKEIKNNLRALGVEIKDAKFGDFTYTMQELFDIFEAGNLGTLKDLKELPRIFADASIEAEKNLMIMKSMWATDILQSKEKDVAGSMPKFKFESKEELRAAIADAEKATAGLFNKMAQMLSGVVQKELERTIEDSEVLKDTYMRLADEISNQNIEPQIDFSNVREDIIWFNTYFTKMIDTELKKLKVLGQATETQMNAQLDITKRVYIERLAIISTEYTKEINLLKAYQKKEQESNKVLREDANKEKDSEKRNELFKNISKKEIKLTEDISDRKFQIEEERWKKMRENERNLAQQRMAIYKTTIDKFSDMQKEMVSIHNSAQQRILDLDRSMADERIRIENEILSNKLDNEETLREAKRMTAEDLPGFESALSKIRGMEQYKGEFLTRARDMAIYTDRLNEAKDVLFNINKLETHEGRPDYAKQLEQGGRALNIGKNLLGGLAFRQTPEEPTKPWEGRPGGMYTSEEDARYKQVLKAYKKEKELVQKHNDEVKKQRAELLQFIQQVYDKINEIQQKQYDENKIRLETERKAEEDKAASSMEKYKELTKAIADLRAELANTTSGLQFENKDALDKIDAVQKALESMYATANKVITLTVKSEQGGTTPAPPTPGVTPPATPAPPITGGGNTYTNVPQGPAALPEGVRKEGETYTNKPEVEKEHFQKVGDTWMNPGKAAETKKEGEKAVAPTEAAPLKQAEFPKELPTTTPVVAPKEDTYTSVIKTEVDRNAASYIAEMRRKKALGLRWGGMVGRVLHAQTGAIIPGFGGGDAVPALLEKGERVFSKETNQFWGNDFLDNMDKMARSPKLRGYPAPIKTINSSQQISNDNRNLSNVSTQNSYTMNIDGRTGAMPPSARDMLREATRIIEGERRRR